MYELKTISLGSSARVFSFVLTVMYIVFAVISLVSGTTAFGSGTVSLLIGIILFGILGAILGMIVAFCYNLVSKRWGGLHLDFKLLDEDEKKD
ncbi:MAG: hypothetical protein CO042_01130 [Parcubacteria group bacterium CG_4_9_14_0_2_um_filter_41_8]|nr:MAG: hypothetical protein COW93_02925 [Parcubacteria group bacterium CG22_combo_CG10-13_8_21_14_all_41_9]PIR57043.1 MAG: hypothetical protein COU72_03050 [Parcubacteria group bacterium CG10_big_fil_rev_8_21_14_0_10_41_35]PIZ82389.1 MAG: hypothetical protein COY02_00215 [Parcubacteria group bacterium CG_4_10_14_0_2_um_filter_41_6]PJC40930.1 MAG: hypothetical protein CO042_01130 [Parcubacteria group bacterium CG_4_9_14_0_2_um_filter_41_8]